MSDTIEQYENMIKQGLLTRQDIQLDVLPESTQKYIAYLQTTEIKIWSLYPTIGQIFIFEIDHPKVKYFIHNPVEESHMYVDDKCENIDNNEAIAELIHFKTGYDKETLKFWFRQTDLKDKAPYN